MFFPRLNPLFEEILVVTVCRWTNCNRGCSHEISIGINKRRNKTVELPHSVQMARYVLSNFLTSSTAVKS